MEKEIASGLYRSLSDPDEFTLTFELVPGRGGRTSEINRIMALAAEIAADGRFQAVSITENAGGHPALSPEALGREIRAMGLEVIIHFSCKDKNRNQMESLLFSWDRQELHNLLVIAGDYPKEGYQGGPKPVFDLDTVQALALLAAMNNGFAEGDKPDAAGIPPTSFLKGVVVSPFKHLEAELMMQYFKLHRKIAAGADFVITQVGFDARKFQELLFYMRQNNLNVPVLGNVFVPSLLVAELMYQGKIPGCVISDSLFRQIKKEAADKGRGKKARLLRAAKLLAVMKGLGYSGAHIGGPGLSFADLDFLVSEAASLSGNWRELLPDLAFWPQRAFYCFGRDTATGLNSSEPFWAKKKAPPLISAYSLSAMFHELAFAENGLFCSPMKKICLALDGSHRDFLNGFEHLLKFIFYGCRNCGDCTLAELAFLCPQAGCAKYLLNGPCGGSRDGWCEVYPGRKRCLYVLLYERLKRYGREKEAASGYLPPRDWSLSNTSSWANFFLGRDHAGKK